MKTVIASLVAALLLICSNLAWSQAQGAQPFEVKQVENHCGTDAPFFHINVVVQMDDGTKSTTNVINCLSNKDGLLVTFLCDLSTKSCKMTRDRDRNAPAIESELRKLTPRSTKQKT